MGYVYITMVITYTNYRPWRLKLKDQGSACTYVYNIIIVRIIQQKLFLEIQHLYSGYMMYSMGP